MGKGARRIGRPSMTLRTIPDEVKSDPDYADGYSAAFGGRPFDTDRADSEPYSYGFEAGDRAVELFASHGFSRARGGIEIKLTARGARP